MTAILFDMDGVLIDSEEYWVEREREHILPTAVEESVSPDEITGMNYREIYDFLAERYTMRVDRAEFIDLFESTAVSIYGEDAQLMPGTRETLDAVAERDPATGLVSSSPHDWIDTVVERFDLDDDFDVRVSAEDIDAPGKPEPHIYRHAAEKVGVEAPECIAIEDSTHGVEAAARAGMTTVGYRTHLNAETDLSAADVVANGPDALRKVVLERL